MSRFIEILNSPELLLQAVNEFERLGNSKKETVRFSNVEAMNKALKIIDKEGLGEGKTYVNRDDRFGKTLQELLPRDKIKKIPLSKQLLYEAAHTMAQKELHTEHAEELSSFDDIESLEFENTRNSQRESSDQLSDTIRNQIITLETQLEKQLEKIERILNNYQYYLQNTYLTKPQTFNAYQRVEANEVARPKLNAVQKMLAILKETGTTPHEKLDKLDNAIKGHRDTLSKAQDNKENNIFLTLLSIIKQALGIKVKGEQVANTIEKQINTPRMR